MTTIAFTILGSPQSKANSRQIVPRGKKMASIKSPAALEYEESALKQIPMNARLRLAGKVRVTLKIYYDSDRTDLDESIVLDVMQDRWKKYENGHRERIQDGVYQNDKQVWSKRVDKAIDRQNPRTDILIETMDSAQQCALL